MIRFSYNDEVNCMYKRILHEEWFWMKPARHSTWLVAQRLTSCSTQPFYVLLIETQGILARKAIQHLNAIASSGKLRGRIPVFCVRTAEDALMFIEMNPDYRFKFIFVNAVGHAEQPVKTLKFMKELQDRCGFPGEIVILSDFHRAPINQRLEEIHSKKRVARSTTTS